MTVKEQLSASNQKIITPNKTLVGVEKPKKKEIADRDWGKIKGVDRKRGK